VRVWEKYNYIRKEKWWGRRGISLCTTICFREKNYQGWVKRMGNHLEKGKRELC